MQGIKSMPEPCIFCQIIARTIPAEIVYRDDLATAFLDQRPAAPTHILVVPNRHISSLNHAEENDEKLLGHLMMVARQLADHQNIHQSGYRIVLNTGADAGQTVSHLHLHLMGGERLSGLKRLDEGRV